MSFMSELNTTLGNSVHNLSRTENGALGYRSTQRPLLDMNFKVASYRKMNEVQITNDFMKAFYDDKLMAMKWLFYVRDIRGGLGERRLFRVIFKHLAHEQFNYIAPLVPLMAEYGRYDDLMILFNTPLEEIMLEIVKNTLEQDMKDMRAGNSITLMAKWLPSENASSPKTKDNALKVIDAIGVTARQYRKMLSALRNHIGIIETKMSKKEWESIDYSAVPSRANLIYNGAFLRNDEERRRAFLGKLEKGEVKINASTLYPHDIAHKYMSNSYYHRHTEVDPAVEGLWRALPDYVQGNGSTLVVADGSGSMTTPVSGNITALTVANALAIYFAERAQGQFKNTYITFSERPQIVRLTGDTLRDNLAIASHHNEVANTNIEAVFELVLQTAVQGRMSQAEMPQNIVIISDMEFDSCACTNASRDRYSYRRAGIDPTLFGQLAQLYAQHGYQLPRLVFWNVNSRTGTIPVKENELGVALVSGFSPAIVKMVLSNKLDPYEAMVEILNSERYAPVEAALL